MIKNINLTDTEEKKKKKLKFRWLFQRIEIILKRIKCNWKTIVLKIISLIIFAIGLIAFNTNLDKIKILKKISLPFQFKLPNNLFGISINLMYIIIYLLSIGLFITIAKLVLKQFKYEEYNEKVEIIFTPTTKEETKTIIAPETIVSYPSPFEKDVEIIEFFANSTEKEDWNKKENIIKNYFGYVKGIREEKDKILLYISKKDPLHPDPIYWDNTHLIHNKEFKLVVGKNCFGEDEILNLSINAHTKIAATTGAGKTYLQKNIALQVLLLGELLFVVDLKGIDYKENWENARNCIVVKNIDSFLKVLKKLEQLHDWRTEKLEKEKNNIDTIDKYNQKKNVIDRWSRVVLIIEEACDVLIEKEEIKNLSETEKERYHEIVRILSKLGRKSRATGIYLFINSQRLSANNIPSQLNSCLENVLCGKANSNLSNIVLGNDLADTLIPKDTQGFFINQDGVLIQGYLFNEEELLLPLQSKRKCNADTEDNFDNEIDNMIFWKHKENL